MNPRIGPICVGGCDLLGSRLVRFGYIDEAGVSNPKHEPLLVVAGVVVHGDTQWKLLETALRGIIETHIPDHMRAGFVLHATELFSGGKTLRRDDPEWPRERRWAILQKVVDLIELHKLPIAMAFVERVQVLPGTWQRSAVTSLEHTLAMLRCEAILDEWMANNANDEILKLIAEDHPRNKSFMRSIHAACQNPSLLKQIGFKEARRLPFRHVVDAVSYEKKWESPILQLTDACAFVLKRKLMGHTDCDDFYAPLHYQVIRSSIKRRGDRVITLTDPNHH